MTDGMTRRYNEGEVLSGVQRRMRWTPAEKVRISPGDEPGAQSDRMAHR